MIGAGPAGISGAVTLASMGHKVTLFERDENPGGMARETIPAERLPDGIIRQEINAVISSASGIERRKGATLDAKYGIDDVLAEGFNAVLLAPGLSRSVPLPAGERPRTGVVGALEFLAAAKRGAKISGTVLVIGGGNTAIDAALSAKRAGADDVSIVYRRSFAEMPAWPEETRLRHSRGRQLPGADATRRLLPATRAAS